MLFNSIEFILFFVVILMPVCLLNRKQTVGIRNMLLLLASYAFYAHLHVLYPLLLVYVTLVNYVGGAFIVAKKGERDRKIIISGCVILSLIPLVLLKYLPAYVPSLWLPVGLSFFTFQALTYSIDIYRGKYTPMSLLDVSLFVAFFPTLLSGPIERARNLIPQLQAKLPMTWDNLILGSQYFLWGLFKKVVIADRLAQYVDQIYAVPGMHSGSTLALAAILYSFQIYCDFSGYATMALGVGRMLGIRLTDNFRYPYFACTIKEFWRRWHISLTTWFTEYVYISLGGNRVAVWRWVVNISVVFLLSGIWHGATWAFVVWGGIHAVLYLLEHRAGVKTGNRLTGLLTFVGVTFAWVFFRIPHIGDAWSIICRIFTQPWGVPSMASSAFSTLITLAYLVLFLCVEWMFYRKWTVPFIFRYLGAVFIILSIGFFAVSNSQFVYFQF